MKAKLPGADGPNLAGKRVRLTGPLQMYRDRPEIVLRSAYQITTDVP